MRNISYTITVPGTKPGCKWPTFYIHQNQKH